MAAALALLPVAVVAYKDGPPPNMTGGFGGETCHMCHNDDPLNAPGGSLRVTGVPEAYTPGQSYRLTVALAREGLYTAGFQMTARTAAGATAGSWRVLDERASVAGAFVQHTSKGTRVPSDGENRWEVEWTAPDRGAGEIVFNAAGNASNDDASALGDFIYTVELRSTAR